MVSPSSFRRSRDLPCMDEFVFAMSQNSTRFSVSIIEADNLASSVGSCAAADVRLMTEIIS